jgi:hypothetical protein
LSEVIKPDWNNAVNYTRLNTNVVETPVLSDYNAGFDLKNATANKIYSDKKYNRASFLVLYDGKNYHAYVMIVMADSAYVNGDLSKLSHNTYRKHDADFTGMVLYFTPKGEYNSGFAYVNGQLITPTTTSSPSSLPLNTFSNSNKNSSGNFTVKTDVAAPPTCTDWYLDTYTNGELTSSVYIGTTCDSDTSSSGSTGGGSNNPPAGGDECATPANESITANTIQPIVAVAAPPPGGFPPPTECETESTTTTEDPRAQAAALSTIAANAVIAQQNAAILSQTLSSGIEYGVNQNLTSLTSNTYMNTVPTAGTDTSWTPTFTWDPVNGYTTGFSHAHPLGDAPSPKDVNAIVTPIGSRLLQNAGNSATQFYESQAEVTTETKNGNYIVTVSDWSTMQTLIEDQYSTTEEKTAFNTNFSDIAAQYLTNNTNATLGDAGAYALMSQFGNTINIYYAPSGSTTYTPLTITTYPNGTQAITKVICSQQ